MINDLNLPEDLDIGNFVNEVCPKCGESLLENSKGQQWCSHFLCSYGICEPIFKAKRLTLLRTNYTMTGSQYKPSKIRSFFKKLFA